MFGFLKIPKFENLKFDLLAGVSVALIALPLSLGLATASGAPPISGIISSIVGGIIVALFGGAYISITGPGKGVIIVILSAILTLGNGDLVAGFQLTLATVIVSGILMIIMGFFRLGILAEIFPSSVIQGLLATIGLIIISQQFHVLFGIDFIKKEFDMIKLLLAMPNTIYHFFSFNFYDVESLTQMSKDELFVIADSLYITDANTLTKKALIDKIIRYQPDLIVGTIGIVCLAVMFIHSKVHLKVLHILPAPMWVILIVCGTYYCGRYFYGDDFISSSHTISLPGDIKNSIIFPDFSKILHKDSLITILSITLIGTIESLLSMKAVDKLDPYKRRSNANKDLKALGLAGVISGFLGGLPVVTAIAASSVNVNNGAKTRGSNFFHGLFLLVIILVFKPVLASITYSALAAILVYTGYKLCAPRLFFNIYKIGKGQLVIFVTTLIATIITNLLSGIMIGVLATILLQIIKSQYRSYFLREIFLPNTILFEEGKGKYYISVKWISNFMNFFILKKKLDSIPRKKHITLDFSMAKLVDTSVMEQVFFYKQDYNKNGTLEVIGLDLHQPSSNHQFAIRHILHDEEEMTNIKNLNTHQQHIRKYMLALEWEFKPEYVYNIKGLKKFPYFNYKNIDYAFNICRGEKDNITYTLFDIEYHEGEFIAKEDFKSTMVKININFEIPHFVLDKKTALTKLINLKDADNIILNRHKDFSKRFNLKGRNKKAVIEFFTDNLILFFESNNYYHIESAGDSILVAKKERLARLSEIKSMVDFSNRFIQIIKP